MNPSFKGMAIGLTVSAAIWTAGVIYLTHDGGEKSIAESAPIPTAAKINTDQWTKAFDADDADSHCPPGMHVVSKLHDGAYICAPDVDAGPMEGQWMAGTQATPTADKADRLAPSEDAAPTIICTYMDGRLVSGDADCADADPAAAPTVTPTPQHNVAIIPVRDLGVLPTAITQGR